MNGILKKLTKTTLFAGFPEEIILHELLPHGQLQQYAKDQVLIEPQQKVSRFGVILSGKIQIFHLFSEGNYSLMSVLTAGEILGADLICTRSQLSPYHAMAAEAACVLYFPAALLTQAGFLQEQSRLDALNRLLMLISQENMKKTYRLAILSQKGLRERIMTYLTMQAARRQTSTFSIPFSREELASFLCVNRSALSHELSLMQQEGILSFHKNVFTLL